MIKQFSNQSIFDFVAKHKIEFHEDSAHGWLKVPNELIGELGIGKQITSCSYRDARHSYLEEDYDLSIFLKALGIGYTEDEPIYRKQLRDAFFRACPTIYKDHSPIRSKAHFTYTGKDCTPEMKAEDLYEPETLVQVFDLKTGEWIATVPKDRQASLPETKPSEPQQISVFDPTQLKLF